MFFFKLSNKLKNNKLKYNAKIIILYNYFLDSGLQLGGSTYNFNIRTSSIIFSKRNNNFLLNLSISKIQINKILKIIEIIIFKRGTIYLINSLLSFQFSMFNILKRFNSHILFRYNKYVESIYIISKCILVF